MRRRPRPSSSRRPRPPRVPAPSLHPGERVRGSAILDESPSADAGLVLWESYRNVGDWAATPRERRVPAMFGPEAAQRRTEQLRELAGRDRDLARALEPVRDLLADPAGADAREVALACRLVASWAGANGRPVTQFYFAAAAAVCIPEDARQAYETGRIARDLARWDAAEVWLEYATAAARRKRDRETQTTAVLGLGNLFYRRGLYGRARDTHLAALALARRHELREHQGRALHDLFVMSGELGDGSGAEKYAREALSAYGPSHANVPFLAHDVAYFWLSGGEHARALPVLKAVIPFFARRPAHRVMVLANTARAAAGVGDRKLYMEMVRRVQDVSAESSPWDGIATAFVEAAVGARMIGEQTLAEEFLTRASTVALERGESDVVARVEELHAKSGAATLVVEPEPPSEPVANELALALVDCLNASSVTDSSLEVGPPAT